ncbi:hypothetical protein C5167_029118 [Papaver somniferum]|nr:hypothetical protein C5167_029118 [Papaver somniferum]
MEHLHLIFSETYFIKILREISRGVGLERLLAMTKDRKLPVKFKESGQVMGGPQRPFIWDFLHRSMGKKYNSHRSLMSSYFKSLVDSSHSIEEIKAKPYKDVPQDNWEWLCNHFSSPEFKKRSLAGSANREKVQYNHCSGSMAFVVRHEQSMESGNYSHIQVFHDTHTRVIDKTTNNQIWLSDEAHRRYDQMLVLKEQSMEEGSEPRNEDDICAEVLGSHMLMQIENNYRTINKAYAVLLNLTQIGDYQPVDMALFSVHWAGVTQTLGFIVVGVRAVTGARMFYKRTLGVGVVGTSARYLLLEFTKLVKYPKHPEEFACLGGKLLKPQEVLSDEDEIHVEDFPVDIKKNGKASKPDASAAKKVKVIDPGDEDMEGSDNGAESSDEEDPTPTPKEKKRPAKGANKKAQVETPQKSSADGKKGGVVHQGTLNPKKEKTPAGGGNKSSKSPKSSGVFGWGKKVQGKEESSQETINILLGMNWDLETRLKRLNPEGSNDQIQSPDLCH